MRGLGRLFFNDNRDRGDVPDLAVLWAWRMLVPLEGYTQLVTRGGFSDDGLASFLEMTDLDPAGMVEFEPRTVRREFRIRYQLVEQALGEATVPEILHANVRRLGSLVGLSALDMRILELAVMLKTDRLLPVVARCLEDLSTRQVIEAISALLQVDKAAVSEALSLKGRLNLSGLLRVDRSNDHLLDDKLDLLSDSFADLIVSDLTDPVSLLGGMVQVSAKAHLGREDYPHIKADVAVLEAYLQHALESRLQGVNVLAHGSPGTGKTELSRLMASQLDCALYEISTEDEQGEAISGERRLSAFRAAQAVFAGSRTILLFDEVEDVLSDGGLFFGRRSTAQARKGWVNRMLETNAVPAIWLSNDVRNVDPAFIRRFDLVLEIPVPSRSHRLRMIERHCAGLLAPGQARRIARTDHLAPALLTRAAKVVSAMGESLPAEKTGETMLRLIDQTLKAQFGEGVAAHDAMSLPELYDPGFVRCDADLVAISAALTEERSGRVCLYGPPGTGKTAYGRWLAGQLDAPLMLRKVSDLVSPWVGMTEKNFARAFEEAAADGAVLMIDEIDSFLQDRRNAERAWELTAVNEMLTQMEAFPGVFIASTNLMDGLDPAALRRFDLKLRFDFLAADQACGLFERYCASLKLGRPTATELGAVGRLSVLTPGDFAAVARQHRLRRLASPVDLVAALEYECGLKGVRPAIGFA